MQHRQDGLNLACNYIQLQEQDDQEGEVSEDENDGREDPNDLKSVGELINLVQRGTRFFAKKGLSTALNT